jgi:phage tail sheath gpL-like
MPKKSAPSTTTVLTITHHEAAFPTPERLALDRGMACGEVARFFDALGNGGHIATVEMIRDGGNSVAASGTVTASGASGSVSVLVNGVTFSTTASGGDAATMATLAAAITASADPLVAPFVTASAALGVLTVTAKTKGAAGNTITLGASGTGLTASGNRLTGGADASGSGKVTVNT